MRLNRFLRTPPVRSTTTPAPSGLSAIAPPQMQGTVPQNMPSQNDINQVTDIFSRQQQQQQQLGGVAPGGVSPAPVMPVFIDPIYMDDFVSRSNEPKYTGAPNPNLPFQIDPAYFPDGTPRNPFAEGQPPLPQRPTEMPISPRTPDFGSLSPADALRLQSLLGVGGSFGTAPTPTFTPSAEMPFGGVGGRPFASPVTPEQYQNMQDYYAQDIIAQAEKANRPLSTMPPGSGFNMNDYLTNLGIRPAGIQRPPGVATTGGPKPAPGTPGSPFNADFTPVNPRPTTPNIGGLSAIARRLRGRR